MHYKQALEIRRNIFHDNDHVDIAQSLNNVGIAYELLNDDRRALEYKMLALEMRKRLLSPDNPNIIDSLNSVYVSYTRLGEDKKALDFKVNLKKIFKLIII